VKIIPTEFDFDREIALAKCYDREMFDEMREYFFSQSGEVLQQMRLALTRGDLKEIARAAHALKGTVAYLGSQSCWDAVLCADAVGDGGDLNSAAESIERLAIQVELLKGALMNENN
jgi:HPt (histidine-containing phosphotransfer) domain-containing protein